MLPLCNMHLGKAKVFPHSMLMFVACADRGLWTIHMAQIVSVLHNPAFQLTLRKQPRKADELYVERLLP